ncbi:MAG: MotA/TolQ/ExbB proton channel family protein [Candidatus Latescibacterota bacterium]
MALSYSVLRLVAESGLVVKVVLLVLLGFSVVSWAIIGQKVLDLQRVRRHTGEFLGLFRAGGDSVRLYKQSKALRASPQAALFCARHELLSRHGRQRGGWSGSEQDQWRLLEGLAQQQVGRLEKSLAFLATVANVSPFVGLLGTVWGIMSAFQEIGLQGSANLAVVAPGIAEALIATAVGLGAAIPAVVAYNYFLARIDAVQRELDLFVAELSGTLESATGVGAEA